MIEDQCAKLAAFYQIEARPLRETMPLADFLVRRGRVLAAALRGNAVPEMITEAHALVDFAKATAQADGTKKIFLVGDFNSYTQEDPMQVLYQNGFVNQPSDDPRDTSYEFDGQAGSLDHVLANTAAANIGKVSRKFQKARSRRPAIP